MEHIEASIRGVNSRLEKLESDTVRLGHELARLRDGRQADQERLRHDLSVAIEAASSPTREIHELRAQLVSLAGAVRGLQTTEHALDNRQEDTTRRIENVWARIESFEGRLDEDRRTAERALADVAMLRTELGRTVEALHTIRDNQSEHAEATRSELDALREASVEPGHRLARLEERAARRSRSLSEYTSRSVTSRLRARARRPGWRSWAGLSRRTKSGCAERSVICGTNSRERNPHPAPDLR